MATLDEKTKQKIIAVISALIPDAKIYLFGSRARGVHAEYADIDIALDAGGRLPRVDVDEVRSMFVESNIPFIIDVVDLHAVNANMRQQILKERIVWK